MHRVELKTCTRLASNTKIHWFLMHRVELKTVLGLAIAGHEVYVPNAPCGVENPFVRKKLSIGQVVPNTPCGVENRYKAPYPNASTLLVPNAPCGVENSDSLFRTALGHLVPNAPCGVESNFWVEGYLPKFSGRFLMHRVELKAFFLLLLSAKATSS